MVKIVKYLQCGEVNDIVNVWILGKNLVESRLISYIGSIKLWTSASQELNSIDGFLGGVVKAVDNDDFISCI